MDFQHVTLDEIVDIVDAIAASVAVVDLDGTRPAGILACNVHFRNMLGMPREAVSCGHFREAVPDEVRSSLCSLIEDCASSVRSCESLQAFAAGDDRRWWRISAQPVLDTDRRPTAVLLTCIDVTETVDLEDRLATAKARLGAIIESAYDGIVSIDSDHRIVLFNAAAEAMFGYRADEVLGQRIEMLMPERFRDDHVQHVGRFARSPELSRTMSERIGEITGRRKDGSEFPLEAAISKMRVRGSLEFTAAMRDVSERVRLIEQLERQAKRDLLTGIYNRRAFYDRAAELIALSRRNGQPLAVAMGDMDHFKRINDRFGHAAGDAVLKVSSRIAQDVFRASDVPARMGGEEFAVLMPETEEHEAAIMLERLRQAMNRASGSPYWEGRTPIPFTMSIGVAAWRPEEATIDEALQRADKALYAAKRAGRDCVRSWSELAAHRLEKAS